MATKDQEQSKMSLVCMESETFSHQGELVWSIKNFVSKLENHINHKRNTTIVYIDRKDKGPNFVSAEIQCSFQNAAGDAFQFPNMDHILYCFGQHNHPISVQFNSLLPWDLSKYSSEDVLILRCQMRLRSCCDVTQFVKTGEYKTGLGYQLPTDLISSLQKLHAEKPFSDFKIKVGDATLPAHKAILSVRSPVFQKMLEHEMFEKQNNVIEITDVQPKIMAAFLSFLYTNIVEDLTIDEFRQLFAVADKYQVDSLKDRCTSLLLKNLDEETVCKTLKLADMHNNDIMKEIAARFISDNFSSLRNNPEFIRLMDSDPRLVLHIVLANSMQPQLNDSEAEFSQVRPQVVSPPNQMYSTIPPTTTSSIFDTVERRNPLRSITNPAYPQYYWTLQ